MRTIESRGYKIFLYKDVRLRQGVLVQGLPGIGLVGKLAVDYIVDTLGLEKVAELIGPGLLLPVGNAGVFVDQAGVLKPPSYKFYLYTGEKSDVLFLTSEVQPVNWAQYDVAECVLDFFTSIGGKTVIGVCGTSSDTPTVEVVYAIANTSRVQELESLGLKRSAGGTITGACGLLPTLAALRGLEGFVIMGSTHTPEPNLASSREVVRVLASLLKITVSLEGLDKLIQEEKMREEELRRELEKIERAEEKKEGLPSWYV